ncbi:MAG: hypothetical protein ACYC5Q_15905 [Thermoleophilia bacterium]
MSRETAGADALEGEAGIGTPPGREIVVAALAAGHSSLDESSAKALFAPTASRWRPGAWWTRWPRL